MTVRKRVTFSRMGAGVAVSRVLARVRGQDARGTLIHGQDAHDTRRFTGRMFVLRKGADGQESFNEATSRIPRRLRPSALQSGSCCFTSGRFAPRKGVTPGIDSMKRSPEFPGA
jgi:hypothetical protein